VFVPSCVVQRFRLCRRSDAWRWSLGHSTFRNRDGLHVPQPRSETPIDLPGFTEDEAQSNARDRSSKAKVHGMVLTKIHDLIAMAFRASALSVPSCWSDGRQWMREESFGHRCRWLDRNATIGTPRDGDGSIGIHCERRPGRTTWHCPSDAGGRLLAYLKPRSIGGEFLDA